MNKRQEMVKAIDSFFDHINEKPEQFDVDELTALIESIIPVHVNIEVTNYDEIDDLLAVYPYLYQKLIRIYAYFIHKVRIGVQSKDRGYADIMRGYRDPLEVLLKACKLQYESLSRRITNLMERR
jgi:hypothetical protein